MIQSGVILYLLLKLTNGGSWEALVYHTSHSQLGFEDVWYNSSYAGGEHFRSSKIDNWNVSSPSSIAFGPYSSGYGGYLMLKYLETDGATYDTSSWLTTERIRDGLSSMSILLRKGDVLFISNYSPGQPVRDDKVWFAHLYTTQYGYVTVMTTDSYPQYIWKNSDTYNFGLETVIYKEDSVQSTLPSYYLHVPLNISNPVYVHAVSVDATCSFNQQCDYKIVFSITYNYTLNEFSERCDGVRHNISIIRAATMTFIFSCPITTVNYKIYVSAWPLIIAPHLKVRAYYEDPVVTTEAEMESTTTTIQMEAEMESTTQTEAEMESTTQTEAEMESTTNTIQTTTSAQTLGGVAVIDTIEHETTHELVTDTTTVEEQTTKHDTTSEPMTTQSETTSEPMTTQFDTTTPQPMTQQLDSTIATTSRQQGTTEPSDMCFCSCESLRAAETWNALSETEQQQYITESVRNITKELLLNTSTLSSTIREKISVKDERTSSTVVGYFGVAFLVTVLGLLILPDIIQFVFYLHLLRTN